MTTLLGSLVSLMAVSQMGSAAYVNAVFTCAFTNAANQPVFLEVQASGNGGADIVSSSTPNAEEGVEPTPGWYDLEDGVMSVFKMIPVKVPGQGRTLGREEQRPVLAFQLKWIKGEKSKAWTLISKQPLVAKLAKAPVCRETAQ